MLSEQEKQLIALIDRDELVVLTGDLVRIDSVIRSDIGTTEREVVSFLQDWLFRETGVRSLREEVTEGRENLIAEIDSGKPGRCLLLEGHTDVVSEGDPTQWTYGPFSGKVVDGKLYGRGSCDMKGGLAINLLCAKTLASREDQFPGKLKLGFICDEEDMMIGIKDFIRKGHADDVDAALVSEPEENHICLSMKGAIRAIVRVRGKMAHGAMPLQGINPNSKLAKIILAFEDYEKKEIERLGKDLFVGYPSITFTVVQAPPLRQPFQFNVIPNEAVGYVDIRTIPAQEHHLVKNDLQDILHAMMESDRELKADIDFFEDRPVVSTDPDEYIVRVASGAYTDITGKPPIFGGVPGATDGTFLRAWKHIPTIVNGPGSRIMPHQVNEYIDIDQLYEAAKIYLLTVSRYLREAPM